MSSGMEELELKTSQVLSTFLDLAASGEIFLLILDIATGPVKMNYHLMINQCNIYVFCRL